MNKIIGSLVIGSLLMPSALFAFESAGISYEEAYPQDSKISSPPVPELYEDRVDEQMPEFLPYTPEEEKNIHNVSKAYRDYYMTGFPDIIVPTVVQLSLEPTYYERASSFAVLEIETGAFLPYRYDVDVTTESVRVVAKTSPSSGVATNLLDNRNATYVDYNLPESGLGVAVITLTSETLITSSAISTLLDNNVALPVSVEVRAGEEYPLTTVVGKNYMGSQTVRFLETTASIWQVTYEYSQPLRITELNLSQSNVVKNTERSLRFLAQPNHSYKVFYNPDRYVKVQTAESGNLSSDEDVLQLGYMSSSRNTLTYTEADVDNDGVPDRRDNCVNVENKFQEDINRNGRGDVCDDYDRDGIINSKDNCENQPNRNQLDTDNDGIGDVCDEEESRITEKYVWLPWAGMGFAALVIIIMFITAISGMKKENEQELDAPSNNDKEKENEKELDVPTNNDKKNEKELDVPINNDKESE